MPQTYTGILRGNHIEWNGDAPEESQQNQGLRFCVTVLEKTTCETPDPEQGRRMAAALERLAASQTMPSIPDPLAWERKMREDRSLPG